MWGDSEGVGDESRFKGDVQSSLQTVGSVFDGGICGRSLRALNGRRCVSDRELAEEGMLFQRGGETNLDTGIADLPHCTSGKVKEGHL